MTTAPRLPPGGRSLGSRGQSSMRPETHGSSPGGSHSVSTTSEFISNKHLDYKQDAVFIGSDCIDSYFEALSAL